MWRMSTNTSRLANVLTYGQFRFLGCKIWTRISHFIFLTCKELVRFFADGKNTYQIFSNMKNRYQILTHVKNWYQFPTAVINWYQIIASGKLVSNFSLVKNWYQILTHVNSWYRIITYVKHWYLIVTEVSNKTVKNWNRMQNTADLGDIL